MERTFCGEKQTIDTYGELYGVMENCSWGFFWFVWFGGQLGLHERCSNHYLSL